MVICLDTSTYCSVGLISYGSNNCITCKTLGVQTLMWSLVFVTLKFQVQYRQNYLSPVKWNVRKMSFFIHLTKHPANIYLFKVNDRNTRKIGEICSKLTLKTPEPRQ